MNHEIHYLYDLDIHHLIPRRLSPSLTYDVSNMILICKKCHHDIEENHPNPPKSPYKYRSLTFCHLCGLPIEFRRDRIGDDNFHPECMDEFLNSDLIFDYIYQKRKNYEKY